MIDFINYQRMDYAIEAKFYTPLKVTELYLDDHFENGISEYHKNVPFKFENIKFRADLIGPVMGVDGHLMNRS